MSVIKATSSEALEILMMKFEILSVRHLMKFLFENTGIEFQYTQVHRYLTNRRKMSKKLSLIMLNTFGIHITDCYIPYFWRKNKKDSCTVSVLSL